MRMGQIKERVRNRVDYTMSCVLDFAAVGSGSGSEGEDVETGELIMLEADDDDPDEGCGEIGVST